MPYDPLMPKCGLMYVASDSRGKLRIGWIANKLNNDYHSLDAWLEALRNLKMEEPDFSVFDVHVMEFSDFAKITHRFAED